MNATTATFGSAGTAFDAARAQLADFDARHATGQHFWRWMGRMQGGHHLLGCMFCARRTVGGAA